MNGTLCVPFFDYVNLIVYFIFGWSYHGHGHLLHMEDLKIEKYLDDLKQLCANCKREKKCLDHNKLCIAKKLLWNISKRVYKQRVKEGKL